MNAKDANRVALNPAPSRARHHAGYHNIGEKDTNEDVTTIEGHDVVKKASIQEFMMRSTPLFNFHCTKRLGTFE